MRTYALKNASRIRPSGFTFFEGLIVASVIGIVATIAYIATSTTAKRSSDLKLRSDVDALNRAVQIYVASGGDVSTASDSEDVLARLKTQLNNDDAKRYIGLTSSMADVRIKAVYQSPEEAASDQLRAAWDPEQQRFILGNAGDAAIKKFIFDEGQAGKAAEFEDRSHSTGFMYALNDEWIWDFEDRPQLAQKEVTPVTIYFDDHESSAVPPGVNPNHEFDDDPSDPGGDPNPDNIPELTPPVISPEGDKYLYSEFPIAVTLTHHNPAGIAVIRYAINEESFRTYSGPFFVEPDDNVRAYCASTDKSLYLNSVEVSAFYDGVEQLFSGIASGDWRDGFQYGKNNNGHGNNEDGVDVSNPGSGDGGPNGEDDPSGNVDDEKKPTDNGNAVVAYYEDGRGSVFEWGTPAYNTPPNSLSFEGSTIINVEPDQLFRLGHLNYYNGSVYAGTEADEVTLMVEIDMTTPDRYETFPITFSLENTTNHGVDPDIDADYVRMDSRSIPMSAELNGKRYYLVVEFGEVNDNGFSSVNQFHVHENKTAQTSLYGYFTENPPPGLESYADQHNSNGGGSEQQQPPPVTPTLFVANAVANEGGHLNFSAILNSPTNHDVVISFSTADGTASAAGGDYVPRVGQTVVIPAGQVGRTISVATLDDDIVEANETVALNYYVVSGSVFTAGSVAVGQINNTDGATLAITGASANEGGIINFTANLDKVVDTNTVITYSTNNGSARSENGDYVSQNSQTMIIPAGQTTGIISVTTSDDEVVELNETVFLAYTVDASGRAINQGGVSSAGTIVDTDSADLSIASASAIEGQSLRFVVTLSKASDSNTIIRYSTANGTATTADRDYRPVHNRSLTIPPGETSGSIWISSKSDTQVESDETLYIEYSIQPTGRAIFAANSSALGTILNDDDGKKGKGWK